MKYKQTILTLLLALLAQSASAQAGASATLQGRVVDSETGEPLVGANVFIATSMIGTATDNDGRYSLTRVPLGTARLYVSMLGFEPGIRDILIREARVHTFDFQLEPTVLEAGEVVVEAERDEHWQERFERFVRLFIGESPNADSVTVLNAEVLDFTDRGGSFRAIASGPLVLENRALGYRIQYFLKDFEAEPLRTRYDGEPLFEELEASSIEEARRWEANRRTAFLGSFRHFMLALISGRTEGQGFKTYSRPNMNRSATGTFAGRGTMSERRFPIDPSKLIRPGESASEHILDFSGYVELIYMGETEDPAYFEWTQGQASRSAKFQTSWITMERGPTIVDYKGDILDPYGVTFSGYLAVERVADEVPKEYRPR